MTRSCVRVLPVISIRSTKARGPSVISKLRSTRRASRSRVTRGSTATKGKPRAASRSVSRLSARSTASPSYQSPTEIGISRARFDVSSPRSVLLNSIAPTRYRGPSLIV